MLIEGEFDSPKRLNEIKRQQPRFVAVKSNNLFLALVNNRMLIISYIIYEFDLIEQHRLIIETGIYGCIISIDTDLKNYATRKVFYVN